ncbi:hypothetical protein L6452_03761 [Arctium lappa]|uniref:Uncharacterized protein n=1 Tax=Arctium lappa TaxID=4217 RepID=A0ACB9FPS3_ARCLA|nr:hypothetical protein L6452_03761 [Arctium lappa]
MKLFKFGFLCFLLLFLGFNFSATASRSFRWMKNEVAIQEIHFQDEMNPRSYEERLELDELTIRRMDLENTDYGGTGANDRHDPKSPGRA